MEPVVLDVAGGVRGWLHLPDDGVAPSGTAVLLAAPLGWDEQASYRPRRVWAGRLAAEGHAVLRVDLPGAGDSAGGPRDPDRLGAWLETLRAAPAWLRRTLAPERLAAIGLGGGGLLLLAAGEPWDALVLWAVPGKGRKAVRELKAFGRLEAAETGEDVAALPEGELHTGGFVVAPETTAALGALDGAAGLVAPARALLLGRDGVAPDGDVRAALEAGGTAVEEDAGDGWGDLVATPQLAVVPEAAAARVAGFLRTTGTAAPWPAVPAAPPLRGDGWSETAFVLPHEGTVLRGVLTTPDATAGDLGLVLLNAGALHHVGPNRLWVEAARRAAARGVPALRLDLDAIGDADGEEAPYADDLALYAPAHEAQVRAALDAFADRSGTGRFTLAGLCSGAYLAFQTALADPRVRTAVMFNPRLLWRQEDAAARYELFRALSVFRRGGLQRLREATGAWRRLRALVLRLPGLLLKRLRGGGEDPLADMLETLRRRDQRVVLAFSHGDEPLRDELEREGRWPQLDAAGVRRTALPAKGHTLKALEAQRAAHAVLDEALDAQRPAPVAA